MKPIFSLRKLIGISAKYCWILFPTPLNLNFWNNISSMCAWSLLCAIIFKINTANFLTGFSQKNNFSVLLSKTKWKSVKKSQILPGFGRLTFYTPVEHLFPRDPSLHDHYLLVGGGMQKLSCFNLLPPLPPFTVVYIYISSLSSSSWFVYRDFWSDFVLLYSALEVHRVEGTFSKLNIFNVYYVLAFFIFLSF